MNDKKNDIKFETALSKLETLVSEMESGELSLDESIAKFKEGILLSEHCKKKLNSAEKKVEILMNKSIENPNWCEF